MNMSETQLFAAKHTHALSVLGYRYVLIDPSGAVCQSTVEKYLVQRPDGTIVGNLEPKAPEAVRPAKRARKRRPRISFDAQTNYISKIKAMQPGQIISIAPPPNTTAQLMRPAVRNAAERFLGKGNFEITTSDGLVLLFYVGQVQAVLV